MSILEYALTETDQQVVMLKIFAKPLSVQFVNGSLCLWASVSESLPDYPFTVSIIGTGKPVPDDLHMYTFLGTIQKGETALHVFIKPNQQQ